MESKGNNNFLKRFEGDKVILIIVLLLLLVSFLAIFSSTPLLPAQASRLKTMFTHGAVAVGGIVLMLCLYYTPIDWFKKISKFGFIGSFIMLAMLLMKVNIPGILKTQTINGAVRNFSVAGFQIHVFEIVKVAMIMYLAWAMNAIKDKSVKLGTLNFFSNLHPRLKKWRRPGGRRVFYVYIPTIIISLMIFVGSGSSSIFICAILIAAMLVGGIPMKELLGAGAVVALCFVGMVTVYKVSDGKAVKRVGTMISRMNVE